ncbi:hypothetical protein [Alicyclobacillus sp. ALC3]|uniref:hypothetical protein n=1 Tax=Alicyclobacillus sp. ALC3 TaxID=2796143 RepID=UPI0023799FCF|nr:hypothetical protein [Alicyclobacillus sp. ALC3]WDL98497.1 hypothetical protein JC200_07400 [Alicyclobacillus sp. ALC3]
MVSFVKADGNGNRTVISADVVEHTGATDSIQILLHDDGPIFCNNAPGVGNRFGLRPYGKKHAIYACSLILEFEAKYELDFSSATSISFQEAEFITVEGAPAVLIPITKSSMTPEPLSLEGSDDDPSDL